MRDNNIVIISGLVVSDFAFAYKSRKEVFYRFFLRVKRRNQVCDTIPILVSQKNINSLKELRGKKIYIEGYFRSRIKIQDNKRRLKLYVLAKYVMVLSNEEEDNNTICLKGSILKEPIYRLTPSGYSITDILLVVTTVEGKTDCIPCVCWGKGAIFAKRLRAGTRCMMKGQIQSRNYNKKDEHGRIKTMTAYECSIYSVTVINSEVEE